MQVCTSLQTDNHASTPPLSFLQARCPSCRPTNSVKALKATTESITHKCRYQPCRQQQSAPGRGFSLIAARSRTHPLPYPLRSIPTAPRSRQITTPAPHYSSFFTGRMPFLPPNQQCQSTEGTLIHIQLKQKCSKTDRRTQTTWPCS